MIIVRSSRFRVGLMFGLLAAALSVRAQVTHLLQSPPTPVPAGTTVTIVMFVLNSGAAAATLEIPAVIPMLAATPMGPRASALLRAAGEPDQVTVAPGGFARVNYSAEVPAEARGLGVLAAEDPTYGRLTVEVVAPAEPVAPVGPPVPAPPSATAPDTPAVAQVPGGGVSPAPLPPRARLNVLADEPVYFSFGAHENLNARFQLSLKIRPFGPADDRVYAAQSFIGNLYASYTQTSLWDLESESKPFFDTSYRPGLTYQRHDTGQKLLGARLGFSAGVEHESNGQGGTASRSMNLLIFRPTLRWKLADGWSAAFSPKLYTYLEKSENPDMPDYRGYGDYVFWVEHPHSWKVATTLRIGTSGKGSVLMDGSYPLRTLLGDHRATSWANGYLHLQYFNGYTESLRTYNLRTPWQVRVGFMVVR